MSGPAMALFSSPDAEALIREVFEKDYVFLVKVATRKLRTPEFSRDAVQSAFIHAWQARRQFKGTSTARTWITRILLNECVSMIRKQACRTAGHEEPIEDLSIASTDPGPEEQHYRAARDRELRLATRSLPGILRNAIEMYLSEVQSKQTAAFKTAKHRAQLALRQAMRDKGYVAVKEKF